MTFGQATFVPTAQYFLNFIGTKTRFQIKNILNFLLKIFLTKFAQLMHPPFPQENWFMIWITMDRIICRHKLLVSLSELGTPQPQLVSSLMSKVGIKWPKQITREITLQQSNSNFYIHWIPKTTSMLFLNTSWIPVPLQEILPSNHKRYVRMEYVVLLLHKAIN